MQISVRSQTIPIQSLSCIVQTSYTQQTIDIFYPVRFSIDDQTLMPIG